MRQMISKVALLTAAFMILALPVLAENATEGRGMGSDQQSTKKECLLVNNCNQIWTLQDKMDVIKKEINKGSAVYSNNELKVLNRMLDDTIEKMSEANLAGY